MRISLTFLGAAQTVTGSRYLLDADYTRFLVECGLYHERELRVRNWDHFPVPPETVSAVLLSHAHLDHCGLLPKFVREGFSSPIYCTAATADIARITLLDAAKLQEEDAEFKRRRHEREGRRGPYPELPLYTTADAEASFPFLSPVKYGQPVRVGEGITATLHDAGHVLGSAMIRLQVKQNAETRTVIFSGDMGGWGKPIVRDPTLFDEADYVVIESTYGDRILEKPDAIADSLEEVINSTVQAGGNIVIPSFALERAQDVLYYLSQLLNQKRIPSLPVFVDSPMAISITRVFASYPELFDDEMTELMRDGRSPFDFPGLKLVRTAEESKQINQVKGSAIIIAGSGMCTGGRIKHHLVTNISRPESTILFVGYQAEGTLGRLIVGGAEEVRILGQYYPLKARVAQINGFSAHADRDQLLKWLTALHQPPRRVFVTHGESSVSLRFADAIKEKTGYKVTVPRYHDEYLLD